MSLLDVVPELLESAAADLKSIGAELNAAHAAAAASDHRAGRLPAPMKSRRR